MVRATIQLDFHWVESRSDRSFWREFTSVSFQSICGASPPELYSIRNARYKEEDDKIETRWNSVEIAGNGTENREKRNTQKSGSESFLFNIFSISRTVTYDRYIPIQTLLLYG